MITTLTEPEMRQLARTHRCGECRARLSVAWGGAFGVNQYVLRCGRDLGHETLVKERNTRRLADGKEYDMTTQRAITEPTELQLDVARSIVLIQERFAGAKLDRPAATRFLYDCMRQGLDPLLGEAAPIVFGGRDGKPQTTVTIITELGYLSLAARTCPGDFIGPPQTRPVTDPEFREAICGDREAHVWEATGRRKGGDLISTWGWITIKEIDADKDDKTGVPKTPKGKLPGNQARVRAIKRWARETFPEAQHKALVIFQGSMERLRAEGQPQEIEEIQRLLDDAYSVGSAAAPRPAAGGRRLAAPTKSDCGIHQVMDAPGPGGQARRRSSASPSGPATTATRGS